MDHIKNSPMSDDEGSTGTVANGAAQQVIWLDDPNDAARVTPWSLDFRQLGRGRLQTKLSAYARQDLSVMEFSMSDRVHQRGAPPPGCFTFAIAAPRVLRHWRGLEVRDNTLLCFGSGEGFDCVSDPGFSAHVLTLSQRRLMEFVEQCGFGLPDDLDRPQHLLAGNRPEVMRNLERTLAQAVAHPVGLDGAAWEQSVLLGLSGLLTGLDSQSDRSASRLRDKALLRAMDAMEQSGDTPLSIEEICQHAGASWRTLDRAFKERFGIGPKAYYTRVRLNQARKDLVHGHPNDSISDTANRHGFWHMGQFARDYRTLFGELPSVTLKR